ncbi:MAG TPA: RNA polymerase sigma factor [Acidimicrobiales bacterium]|nr:RNA polymerase sigma factor [Acidimicrobiales bacterium]
MTTLLTGGGTPRREALDDDVDLARDRELVTRAQAGDRSAFDDLYLRYSRRLYRFCLRRLHDSHEAEDVAQEAFARAWRALPSFGGDRRFYPWLSVIASHLCTDVLRRRNRSTPVAEFHQSNVASVEDGGEELMIAAVDSEMVARAFTRLSDRHQRILNLREGSGWSYQRIADHEGVGITAVETLLWRARQALKREFASLAGAEGRMGAWLGGLFSLATLRRLLSMPRRMAHRVATTSARSAAVAAGSAVAAGAVVMGAALSSPATAPAQNLPPSFTTQSNAGTPAGSGAIGASSSTPGAGATGGPGGAAASPSGPLVPGGTPSLPVPVPGPAAQLGTNLGGAVNGAVNGVGGAVNGVVGGVNTIVSGLPGGNLLSGPVAALLGGASGTPAAGTSGSGSSGSPVGSATGSNPVSSTLGSASSLLQNPAGGLTGG